jgi:hypothetical protein
MDDKKRILLDTNMVIKAFDDTNQSSNNQSEKLVVKGTSINPPQNVAIPDIVLTL